MYKLDQNWGMEKKNFAIVFLKEQRKIKKGEIKRERERERRLEPKN